RTARRVGGLPTAYFPVRARSPAPVEERQGVLRLAARDDAVVPGRGYHLSFLEPGAGQHCRQLAARVLLAPGRPEYRHVECGDPERAGLVVVEERLVEEDPAARLERLKALLDQEPPLFGRPVVED